MLSGAAPAAGATLFISNTKSESASIIDTDTLEVVGTIPLGQGKPNRIVFHPDGRTAWVVYDKSHDLGVIDAEARKLIKRVRIGGQSLQPRLHARRQPSARSRLVERH